MLRLEVTHTYLSYDLASCSRDSLWRSPVSKQLSLESSARFGASFAVAAITIYQRWVSPFKGFRCAYRAHNGGPSCSEYGKEMISSHGISRGLSRLTQRFRECGESARLLRFAEAAEPSRDEPSNPLQAYACPCGGCFSVQPDCSSCWPF